MNRMTIAIAAATLAFGLAGCTSQSGPSAPSAAATTRFPAPAGRLIVVNEFGRVDVKEADTRELTVVRRVSAIGKQAGAPDWTLEGDTLTLKSACGRGYIGLCEPRFIITVPRGTKVTMSR